MKLFWTGTDSLMLIDTSKRKLKSRIYYYIFRMLIRQIDRFIECHYCDSELVAQNIRKFGTKKKIEIFHDKVNYPSPIKKKKHNGFNVLYYNPIRPQFEKKFKRWLYGIDIIEQVIQSLPEINFISADGSMDMDEIYSITDFYIRPNRHDGASRMRQECEINNIPYYWTTQNPDLNDCIEAIKQEYKKQILNKQK